MDASSLSEAMGGVLSLEAYGRFAPAFNEAMNLAEITTVERSAMWCAQLGHESVGLQYMEEIASGEEYEGRADLGNVYPGDGVRFKGRGPIQVTGRSNYAALSKWLFDRGVVPTETFFVDDPEQLASADYGFYGAVWYWATRGLNDFADAGDVVGATQVINGGTNGLADRQERYEKCMAMGDRILPSAPENNEEEEIDMATVEDINTKLDLILDQLAGPGDDESGLPVWNGWPQLGNKSLVDAIADVRNAVTR
ncbi:glycoside hydrolase family 19 protein [Corynebacterium flavescens]|uniref:glycoside hydrolase family 19 protein n=1 Tax=Corynebacterium flavescens TaxID=28028 RepID=UPI003FD03BB6